MVSRTVLIGLCSVALSHLFLPIAEVGLHAVLRCEILGKSQSDKCISALSFPTHGNSEMESHVVLSSCEYAIDSDGKFSEVACHIQSSAIVAVEEPSSL